MEKQTDSEDNIEDKPEVQEVQEEAEETSIENLKKELKEEKNKYLLLLAEMENARKRMQKDKHDATRFAIENVALEFLTPLDNFENALSFAGQTSEETQKWAQGFEMILSQFKDVLVDHKIVPFQSQGLMFDPHMHEVIEIEETEKHKENTVIKEFIRGYKCGDRVLRPARVKMAKNPSKEQPKQENDQVNNKQNQGDS